MTTHPPFPRPLPRLALVVGAGGVRGAAAIGVADALEREGFQIDLVVGCSGGAIFGAAIAAGMPAYHALETAMSLWRPELTRRRRRGAWARLLAPRLLGFDAGFSLRDPRPMEGAFDTAFHGLRLEALPAPLRVAVTDADTGRGAVLATGPVTLALRASVAVPFLFPPLVLGGRRLVDGALSDPLPVAAAADAGAVIAVGFQGPLPARVDRPARLVGQVSTALVNNLQEARLEAARASGMRVLALDVPLERKVGLFDVEAMPHLFRAGQAAVVRHLPAIASLVEAQGRPGRGAPPVSPREPAVTPA